MAVLLAGYGERTITPPLGVELSGYGFYLGRRAGSVLDDLKVRALYLRAGRRGLALLAFDLIGLAVPFADRLRLAVARRLGLEARDVLVACTHTHTGPATQPLPGLGEVDAAYMRTLPRAAADAAAAALADSRPARFAFASETLEPIGFNRRSGSFDGVDAGLRLAAFGRADGRILLLNYACHAVTLGRKPVVSADWPGAAVRALEARGDRALLLQGFSGDVDPVSNLNRWGEGTAEDLALYGTIVAGRAAKAARLAPEDESPALRSAEKRVRVPLAVPPRERIAALAEEFLAKNARFPLADRFAAEWKRTALHFYDRLAAKPYLDRVPIQALAVGGLRILALPGEAFSAYALILGKEFPGLVTAGYANGNVGYLPSGSAFEDPGDYAAHFAPMFYSVFPFRPDLPLLVAGAAREVLLAVGP